MSVKSSVVFFMALASVGFGVSAQAQNHRATVIVDNKTSSTATYAYEQMTGTASPVMGDIDAGDINTYTVTSFADSVSGMRFTYAAGNKKCRFSASHTTDPSHNIPSFKKSADSIGAANATCTVKFESVGTVVPYDYTVRFTIR